MPWNPNSPAGTDAANTIDNALSTNQNALDAWASAITDGITVGASTVLQAYRGANVTFFKTRSAAGDTGDRRQIDLDGTDRWGPGNASPDITISRVAANALTLGADDFLRAQVDPVVANDLSRKSYVDFGLRAQTGGENSLRLLRGRINTTAPSILQGAGFTLVRNGAGDVTVTFTNAFGGIPAVVGTSEDEQDCRISGAPTTTTVRLIRFGQGGGGNTDGVLHFYAIGPA